MGMYDSKIFAACGKKKPDVSREHKQNFMITKQTISLNMDTITNFGPWCLLASQTKNGYLGSTF